MSRNDADRLLTAWLESVAPSREPEHLLADVLKVTSRTRRRPAWRIPERWIPMTTITTRAVAGPRVTWQLAVLIALLVLAVVAGAVLLAGGGRRVPPPFGPATNGAFAYEVDGAILARTADGRTVTLVDEAGLDILPRYSPDGTQLAWLHAVDPAAEDPSDFELRVAAADGSGGRTLGAFLGVGDYAWSPSGDRIAIGSEVDLRPTITMVEVRTGQATPLDVDVWAEAPAFRPGGEQLAFRGRSETGSWGLYLVGVDGTGLVPLALDPGFESDTYFFQNMDFYFFAPAWSPDGTRLAFHTLDETMTITDLDPGFRVHVATVDDAGAVSNEVVLTPDAEVDDEWDAAWLPDGSGLVVHRTEESAQSLARYALPASAATAGPPVELGLRPYTHVQEDLRFVVTPDGTEVSAWEPDRGAWLVPVDGGEPIEVDLPVGADAAWQRTATK